MADQTRIEVTLAVQNLAEGIIKQTTEDVDGLVAKITELQQLGDKRDVKQEFALSLMDGMKLVGRTTDETKNKVEQFGAAVARLKGETVQTVSAGASEADKQLKELDSTVQEVKQKSTGMFKPIEDGAKHSQLAVKKLNDTMREFLSAVATLTGGAVSIGAFFNVAIKGAAELETEVLRAQLRAEDFGVTTKEVSTAVEASSKAYGVAADEVAKLYGTAFSAGAKSATEAQEVVNTALKLGIINGEGYASTMQAVTTVLQGYGLAGTQASKVADQLLLTSQRSGLSFQQLSRGLGNLIPTAQELGISFEELQGSLISLANSGLSPQRSLSTLQSVIVAISRPSKELVEVFEQAGFKSAEAAIKSRGLAGALKIVTDAAKNGETALTGLTGNARIFASVQTLAKEGVEGLTSSMEGLNEALGRMDSQAGRVQSSAGQQFVLLANTVRLAFEQIGTAMLEFILPAIRVLDSLFTTIKHLAEIHPTITALLGFGLAIFSLVKAGAALIKVLRPLPALLTAATAATAATGKAAVVAAGEVTLLASSLELVKKGLGLLAFTPVGRVLAVAVAGAVALVAAYKDINSRLEQHAVKVKAVKEAQEALAVAGVAATGVETKGLAEVSALTDAQLKKYEEDIRLSRKDAEAKLVLAESQDKYGQAAILLRVRLVELGRAEEDVRWQQKLRSDLVKSSTESSKAQIVVEKETAEQIRAHAAALREISTINFDAQRQQLAKLETDTLDVLTLRNKTGEVREAQNRFAQERVRIAEAQSLEMVRVAENEAKRLLAVYGTLRKDDGTFSRAHALEMQKITQDLITSQIKANQSLSQAVFAERQKMAADYKAYGEKIKGIDKQIADLKREGQFSVVDFERQQLGSSQKIGDARLEFDRRTSEIRAAIQKKDFETAKALIERQTALVPQFSQEVVDGEVTIQTAAQAAANAFEAGNIIRANRIALLAKERAVTKEEQASTLANIQSLDTKLADIQKTIVSLQGQKLQLIDKENLIESTAALKEFEKQQSAKIVTTRVAYMPDDKAIVDKTTELQGMVINIPVRFVPEELMGPNKNVTATLSGLSDKKFAEGGPVRGPRSPLDAVLGWLTGGEFVMNPRAVAKYGETFMHAVNELRLPRRRMPRFATGGVVGRSSSLRVGNAEAGSNLALAPVNLVLPFGTFGMSAATDVVASLKAAVMRESLKRRGR
jgi:TP901 family phage tail tape measure protein